MRVLAIGIFLRPPSGALLTGEGLYHGNFKECLRTVRAGLSVQLISRMRSIKCVSLDRYRRFFFLALPAVLAFEVGYTGKTVDHTCLAPDSLIYPVPTALPTGFSWVMFFCQDVADHCTPKGSVDSPFFVCRDQCTPSLEGNMASNPLASVGRLLTSLGCWLAAQTAQTFILHCRFTDSWL